MNRLAGIVLALSSAGYAAGCASQPAYERNPYSADQIVRLLRGAVSPERILHDANRECISFRITTEVETSFTEAGAPASFAEALRATCFHAARHTLLRESASYDAAAAGSAAGGPA
jgi:hypothetical protein